MFNPEDSFLQQIARQPHDWLPRLIFADWLEEQGDPRGELIRLSHQLTRLECEDRQPKEARLQELSAAGVVWPSPALSNHLDMPFVLIPPGQLLMGSPASEPKTTDPEIQVEVTLTRGFWLGQYVVTQAEYQAVMGENPSFYTQERLQLDASRHPVEQVDWKPAMEFCQKLTGQERAAGRLPSGWLYTLPTEAQWEYACRAGTQTPCFFGSQVTDELANLSGQPTPVGSYPPNAFGLYDMHGNVWEWCRDIYRVPPPGGTDPVPVGTDHLWYNVAEPRVFRGGYCSSIAHSCRSGFRIFHAPGGRYHPIGFRVAAVQAR